jgi:hypothetical protein
MKWKIEDIIDLEAFMHADREESEADLETRDADLFELIHADPQRLNPKEKILKWVKLRRNALADAGPTPGESYRIARQTLILILGTLAFLVGLGVASMHLLYRDRPINVTLFFSVTILWQIVVLAVTMTVFLFHKALRFEGRITGLGAWLLLRLDDLRSAATNRLDGTHRTTLAMIWGEIMKRKTIYGGILKWPVLAMIQSAAIALNLGLLLATLGLLAISNRAFGWESTFAIGPEVMLRIVQGISFPWSYLPHAHPTLEEIAASRIALQGVAVAYPADALRSWWPFLCYSIVFWGLIPRIVLLAAANFFQRQALARLEFDHADCNRLLRRMTPLVTVGEAPPELGEPDAVSRPQTRERRNSSCKVIVAQELGSPELYRERIQSLGKTPTDFLSAAVDCVETNDVLFDLLRSSTTENIVLLLEAERPPIRAILSFIREIRGSLPPTSEIAVCLVTRSPNSFNYADAWERSLSALGDPYLNFTAIP